MESKMLIDGLKLMITGMGTVFIFLSLMILVINLISKLLAPYSSLLETPNSSQNQSGIQQKKLAAAEKPDKALLSAIVAAVHKFRENRKKTS